MALETGIGGEGRVPAKFADLDPCHAIYALAGNFASLIRFPLSLRRRDRYAQDADHHCDLRLSDNRPGRYGDGIGVLPRDHAVVGEIEIYSRGAAPEAPGLAASLAVPINSALQMPSSRNLMFAIARVNTGQAHTGLARVEEQESGIARQREVFHLH